MPDVADVVLRSDTTGRVRNAVEVLPDAQRQALELAYFDGYTYRQVAEVLGIPEGTASRGYASVDEDCRAPRTGTERARRTIGMSIDEPHEPPISPDDLAAYALDAHDAGAAVIAAHLDTSPDAVRREQDLRSAAGEFAAAIVDEVSPRPSCVSGSSPRRAGAGAGRGGRGASPIDVHRLEMARAILLLRDLTVDDWTRPVDLPELDGWTVHDVVVHGGQRVAARTPARRAGAGQLRDRHR